jgi:hypothetical protein
VVLPAVAEMLDPLHKLRRGQQWVIPKVSVYFVINSVWKLLNMPLYYKTSLRHFYTIRNEVSPSGVDILNFQFKWSTLLSIKFVYMY